MRRHLLVENGHHLVRRQRGRLSRIVVDQLAVGHTQFGQQGAGRVGGLVVPPAENPVAVAHAGAAPHHDHIAVRLHADGGKLLDSKLGVIHPRLDTHHHRSRVVAADEDSLVVLFGDVVRVGGVQRIGSSALAVPNDDKVAVGIDRHRGVDLAAAEDVGERVVRIVRHRLVGLPAGDHRRGGIVPLEEHVVFGIDLVDVAFPHDDEAALIVHDRLGISGGASDVRVTGVADAAADRKLGP